MIVSRIRFVQLVPNMRSIVRCTLSAAAIAISALPCSTLRSEELPVHLGQEGKLVYRADGQGNRIPDFSHCGYAGGNQPIPSTPVRAVVKPVDGDDRASIQAAIDFVSRLAPDKEGFRGAVLLLAGEYHIDSDLRFEASGVVLRGSGAVAGGTTLIATGTGRRPLVRIGRQATTASARTQEESIEISDKYVPVGATSVNLLPSHTLQVGDRIRITRPATDEWIEVLGTRAPGVGWRAGRHDLDWERIIASVDGSRITFDAPITTALDRQYGGGVVDKLSAESRISQIGIENLALRSAYDDSNPQDESHSWFGVVANNAENVWIRQVRCQHFAGGAILLREATKWVTVEDCLALDPISEIGGYRRNSFFTQGELTLFLRCFAERGRHDFAAGHCAAGPNAFVNCYGAESLDDSGPLESWASGVLYDNVRIDGAELVLANRWTQPPGAGWSAANCLLWQCQAAAIRAFKPPSANNWVLGYWAEPIGDAAFFGQSDFYKPISLYQAQLRDRLGNEIAASVGPFLLDPIASTSPTLEEAQRFVAKSNEPKRTLRDLIEDRLTAAASNSLAIPKSAKTFSTETPVSTPVSSKQRVEIEGGWLTVDGQVLRGGHVNPTWWRGTIRPQDAPQFGPSITRFAPGRYGQGLTDELEEVAQAMKTRGQVAYDHHYGLWYDRRRDDHLMVRRADGNVAPPFFEQPFARTGTGTAWDGLSKYDLAKFNPWYWQRLADFAKLCDRHALVMFHQHYFQHNIIEAGAHWADCPWRPANNVNRVGLPEPPPYIGDKRIFFAHHFYDPENQPLRQLHSSYIRQCLENTEDHNNVIHSIGAEYTGPLEFTQFWIDTVRRWQTERNQDCLVAISTTKDVQDALLEDSDRSQAIDVIDIRYWCYDRDGKLYAPLGGANLAPRQHMRQLRPEAADFESIARAVREYRLRYPSKPVTYFADRYCRSPRDGWAVLMGGGSLANVPPLPKALARSLAAMKPSTGDDLLILSDPDENYLFYLTELREEIQLPLPTGQKYQLTEIDPQSGETSPVDGLVSGDQTLKVSGRVLWLSRVRE